ncbi:tail fiber protein [Xenorhabdus griffiniae]|uniref:Phage tail protein n=1 Tax=Xenorhabdus griffiniae TaxID=351672 RepID=A0ABY9XLS6_9GAMM|nr:phage tail protein [Xenorhabdus griffiniae]MBD1226300.1 tail fiber protein [Xenorhabdus griffiniae]MBE8587845.1 tail fiber protein [Xenorhabdus griffiniae]WMV73892.1 phage tail protein [Xenorhabdus griffiniae]WNH03572.1 phage tail protein [Xenorhabdus griffiniae]
MSIQVTKPETQVLEDEELVVVPTPKYVKDSIQETIEEHAQSRNHPDATLREKGFVILNNAIDRDDETYAATSKAVKTAYDLANTANQNASNANNNANTRLSKDQNGADISDKQEFVNNLGLAGTVILAKNSVQGKQYTGDLTVMEAAWVKIAEVTMGVASTINITLIGGAGYNVGIFGQCAITNIILRSGNDSPHGINAVMYTTNSGSPTDLATVNTSGYNYDIYISIGPFAQGIILNAFSSDRATINNLSNMANLSRVPENAVKGKVYSYPLNDITPS